MATAEVAELDTAPAAERSAVSRRTQAGTLATVLAALASLKLTVILLSLLIFLVFVGTLAQVHHDVWYVVREGYFRVWLAWVEFQTLPTLLGVFKPNNIRIPGGFYFPGGYLIGTAMAINLLVAHGLRFKVTARGRRLTSGLAALALGIAATVFVVLRALDTAYDATISPAFADQLWNVLRGGFAGIALLGAYLLTLAWNRIRRAEWFALAGLDAVLLGVAAYLLLNPQWQINDSGMRIVWQLLQATIAGGLLMAACWLLFAKRAGVVLLHAGVALLMFHEFYVGVTNVETNMMIAEGETANYVFDNRESELAIIDRSDAEVDHVTVIPDAILRQAAAQPAGSDGRVISHPDLPVDLRVVDYHTNTDIRPARSGDDNPATTGAGTTLLAEPQTNVSGVGGQLNIPAAYVELLDPQTGDSLGTLLVTNYFDPYVLSRIPPASIAALPGAPVATEGEQVIDAGGKPLAVAMRFKRIYKPYSVTLIDFSHDQYMGTNVPKNFSSEVHLVDHELGTELDYKIWMNNPLRYRGETFYQADWNKITGTGTILQVVKNEGWMLPYIGCAVVLVGMMVHFSLTLIRFLDRRSRELKQPTFDASEAASANTALAPGWITRPEVVVPGVVALLTVGYLASNFRSQEIIVDDMPVHEFAALPVLDEGRVKPYDSVARNMLQYMASRQEAPTSVDGKERIPASKWLLDVLSGRPESLDFFVFRITNLELLDSLDLPRRPGFFRYSFTEIEKNIEKLREQVLATRDVEKEQLTHYQRDARKLWEQRNAYVSLANGFGTPTFTGPETLVQDFATAGRRAMQIDAPLAVPPAEIDGKWYTLYEADLREHCYVLKQAVGEQLSETPPVIQGVISHFGDERPGAGFDELAGLLSAYRSGDAKAFKDSLSGFRNAMLSYERKLDDPANAAAVADLKAAERLDVEKVRFETWFNSAAPFYYCSALYLIALVLSAASWLGWPRTLGRSATAIIVVTLIVHTLALAARMYISGRPPVTNLYTTAVFNGWAIVLAMMIFESIYKLGIGNFVAAAVGFSTLLVAHFLAMDEDTFTVLQAVLDTQFWLSTHVITINLGYATTMLAGCLGIVYIVMVHLLNVASDKQEKQLARMTYGSLCFAILFSFVGTVLGGLWADDSWGRFWGWDPKENGALMIVLWNAVALHARWGKMITNRGLALLAVFGNVITAWSWFGVNQLSQGLHAYAFRDDLALYLGWFFASQFLILFLGWMPWRGASVQRAA